MAQAGNLKLHEALPLTSIKPSASKQFRPLADPGRLLDGEKGGKGREKKEVVSFLLLPHCRLHICLQLADSL